ncbi:hypothetical protein Nepgr_019317 [Nepenthes gracilis]|uniref:Uncharacterized protein n=1 Tax=Nepenthes gracilis TaxID=150966 RepID=A0AAD3XV72_NEPGR|nr:hypothetical protein Nepgr_019317 [Nepenthes gracilis]
MPSLQTALPPELANNVIRLYRECLRRAKYVGHKCHGRSNSIPLVHPSAQMWLLLPLRTCTQCYAASTHDLGS